VKLSNQIQFQEILSSVTFEEGCYYFPYLSDGKVTVVCNEDTISFHDLDEDLFIRDVDGNFMGSQEIEDIISLINLAYKPEQIDPDYIIRVRAAPKADKVTEKTLLVIRFYRKVSGDPVAVVNWDED
jgi:hypothetical protein